MSPRAPLPSYWFNPEAGPSTKISQPFPPSTSPPPQPSNPMHAPEPISRHDSGLDPAWQDLRLDDDLPITREELARKNSLDFFSAAVADSLVSWQAPRWSSGAAAAAAAAGGGDGIADESRSYHPRPATPEAAEPVRRRDEAHRVSFSMVLDMAKELAVAGLQQLVYPLPGPVRKPRPTRARQRIGHGEEFELQRLDSRTGREMANAPAVPPSAHFSR